MEKDFVENYNQLSTHKWKVLIKRAKSFEFFAKKFTTPDVQLPKVSQPTPFRNLPLTGDHLEYGDFSVSFIVDEDLNNYREILSWIRDIGRSRTSTQYKDLKEKNKSFEDNGIYSEISIFSMTNTGNPNKVITFSKAFPIFIKGLDFDIDVDTTHISELTVSFAYSEFEIEDA